MQVILDEDAKGIFFVEPNQQGNYSALCDDLVNSANLRNVFILTFVSSVSHTLKLKDYETGQIFIQKKFNMKAEDCISQQFNLD